LRGLGKPESLIRYVTDRPGHDRRYAINCEKAEKELGFKQSWTFDKGLKATISWYRENGDWCQQVLSGEYRTWYERNYATRGHK
jgi:dTDP-glucose 4,6-dehydratase